MYSAGAESTVPYETESDGVEFGLVDGCVACPTSCSFHALVDIAKSKKKII